MILNEYFILSNGVKIPQLGLGTWFIEDSKVVETYPPIAHGEAMKNKDIAEIAKKIRVSPAQLCIRYVLQLGMIALLKTADPEHMKENANVDFEVSTHGNSRRRTDSSLYLWPWLLPGMGKRSAGTSSPRYRNDSCGGGVKHWHGAAPNS